MFGQPLTMCMCVFKEVMFVLSIRVTVNTARKQNNSVSSAVLFTIEEEGQHVSAQTHILHPNPLPSIIDVLIDSV